MTNWIKQSKFKARGFVKVILEAALCCRHPPRRVILRLDVLLSAVALKLRRGGGRAATAIRRAARGKVPVVVSVLVLLCAVLAGILEPEVPASVWPICAGLLGGFIVALIALPQVLAAISFTGGLRRLTSRILGFRFWGSLILLILNLMAVLIAASISAGSRPVWARLFPDGLPSDFTLANFGRAVFVLCLFSICAFGLIFAHFALSVSTASRVIKSFATRAAKTARKRASRGLEEHIGILVGVGKDVESGHEKGLVITALQQIGHSTLELPWSPRRGKALKRLILGIGDVVWGGAVNGNNRNALLSIGVFVELYERAAASWGSCDLDYTSFSDAVFYVSHLAIRSEFQSAASRGISALYHLQRTAFRDNWPAGISSDRSAARLEALGSTCLEFGDCEEAMAIAARLLALFTEAKTASGVTRATSLYFLSHFFLLAARIAEKCRNSEGVLCALTKGRVATEEREAALSHGAAISPYWASLAQDLATPARE